MDLAGSLQVEVDATVSQGESGKEPGTGPRLEPDSKSRPGSQPGSQPGSRSQMGSRRGKGRQQDLGAGKTQEGAEYLRSGRGKGRHKDLGSGSGSRAGSGEGDWWRELPVSRIEKDFLSALRAGPVVLTAPTGSGKSTLVPRWCRDLFGRTLVVEPRRVACRALWRFQRDMGGGSAGYLVRHEQQSSDADLLYVTPGVALRMAAEGALDGFECLILDEFHERSLETDLLAALLREARPDGHIVVMSATMETHRLSKWLRAPCLHAEGRLFPVTVTYQGDVDVPRVKGLEGRLVQAVRTLVRDLGRHDVLVFLPGRGEIAAARKALAQALPDLELRELHAGLPAGRQDLVFRRPAGPRVVLSTNVAESSVTLPWVRAVVDSGLERRTSYRRGRSLLSLEVISRQSADQRAGRAGRVGPGRCIRLWSKGAVLRESSVPEILREDLDGLLLQVAGMGKRIEEVPFLDPPRPDVVEAARGRLERLGLLDGDGRPTALGRRAASLPLDPDLARLVLAGLEHPDPRVAEDLVDLAASLSTPGSLFASGSSSPGRSGTRARDGRHAGVRRGRSRGRRERKTDRETDMERPFENDLDARIAVLRGLARLETVRPAMLAEARRVSAQLRGLLDLSREFPSRGALSAETLGPVVLAALPDSCFVRRRGRWAGGGMEASLSPRSFVSDSSEVLLVFDIHSSRVRGMKAEHSITCAMPIPARLVGQAGLVEEELVRVDRLANGGLVGQVARKRAGVALDREDQELRDSWACLGAARLFVQGRWLPKGRDLVEAARQRAALYHRMEGRKVPEALEWDLERWTASRLEALGVQSGQDLDLVSFDDLLPVEPSAQQAEDFDRRFPVRLKLVDRTCEVQYNLAHREVLLLHRSGRKDPPPRPSDLPAWPGWSVLYKVHSRIWRLR